MKKVKFAVIGFGHIGRRHATIINGHPACHLSAIVEVNRKALDDDLIPDGVPTYSSIIDMFDAEDYPDVVTIATPNGVHCSLAVEALKHNCHVVIEKPMGLTREECEQVISTAEDHAKQVFVVKQNRYSPPSKWLKEIVSQKIIGDPLIVQVNCFWNRDQRYYKAGNWKGSKDLDGGSLFTQFSHFVDIMYWVFGDITNIQSKIRDFTHQQLTDFEDSGSVLFDFVNGGMGSIHFSTSVWDSNLESSITVIGSKGSLKIGGQYMNEIEYCHIENYQMPELDPTNPPNNYGPYRGSAANHHFVIDNVVNTLLGKDTVTTNATEGMMVVDIIERIYNAALD
ncbi:MAG: Gfo/Idh/MocA family oxidoreductase [Flavobacteriia bacterium]|nr:Gfo/Idh/MocA family oxidoreductase [Flavobacteriia bacterium]